MNMCVLDMLPARIVVFCQSEASWIGSQPLPLACGRFSRAANKHDRRNWPSPRLAVLVLVKASRIAHYSLNINESDFLAACCKGAGSDSPEFTLYSGTWSSSE